MKSFYLFQGSRMEVNESTDCSSVAENGSKKFDQAMPSKESFTSTSSADDYYLQLEEMSNVNRLPISFVNLLQSLHQRNVHEPAEVLIAILHYLFLESGFVPLAVPAELGSGMRTHWGYSFVAQIPDKSWAIVADEIVQQYTQWRDKDTADQATVSNASKPEHIYTFKLKLFNQSDDEMQLVIRKIFGGSTLCVSFCLEHHEQSTSIILSVNEFISLAENYDFDQIRQNPQQFFHNTRELSRKIKQTLVTPIRNVVMYESEYPNAALNGLPKEILWLMFKYFRSDLSTLQKMSQTCVYLRNLAITFLNESKIHLKHRRPTPITYDASDHLQPRSRYRIYNMYPRIFRPWFY